MGMVSQETRAPSTHPVTGELMYNNEHYARDESWNVCQTPQLSDMMANDS